MEKHVGLNKRWGEFYELTMCSLTISLSRREMKSSGIDVALSVLDFSHKTRGGVALSRLCLETLRK